jgi:hypothetical protein
MRVAIFLRGHARTWNLIKNETINLFNTLYDNPDWYIAMWDSGTVRDESVYEDFKQHNIIYLSTTIKENAAIIRNGLIVQSIDYPSIFKNNNYLKIGYLDSILSRAKRIREVKFNFEYDYVIFIRPDILYSIEESNYKHLRRKIYSLEVTNLDINYNDTKDDYPMSSDFFMKAGSAASNIFCSRVFDTELTLNKNNLYIANPHHKLTSFYMKHKLIYYRSGMVEPMIIRPDYLDFLNGKLEYDKTVEVDSHRFAHNWKRLTEEQNHKELKRYMDQHNISYKDYLF